MLVDAKKSYQKRPMQEEGKELFNVALSVVSGQDTFMRVKERVKAILDLIKGTESIGDMPNVMAERYVFRAGEGHVYCNVFDRLE